MTEPWKSIRSAVYLPIEKIYVIIKPNWPICSIAPCPVLAAAENGQPEVNALCQSLKPDPVTEKDFDDYINAHSNFGFELSVLRMLRDEGIECQHGGLYDDPVTGKSREFDIRASVAIGEYRVKLAIECKNIKSNYPLLVSCLPRHKSESYHHVAKLAEPEYKEHERTFEPKKSRATVISVSNSHSIYPPGEPVGKSIAQISRAAHNGEIISADSDVFDKWSQCLSSLEDPVRSLYWEYADGERGLALAAAIPVLVVPSGRLWMVQYDAEGRVTDKPQVVDRCPCYVGKEYEVGESTLARKFVASHIELMTTDGLKDYVHSVLSSEQGLQRSSMPSSGSWYINVCLSRRVPYPRPASGSDSIDRITTSSPSCGSIPMPRQ